MGLSRARIRVRREAQRPATVTPRPCGRRRAAQPATTVLNTDTTDLTAEGPMTTFASRVRRRWRLHLLVVAPLTVILLLIATVVLAAAGDGSPPTAAPPTAAVTGPGRTSGTAEAGAPTGSTTSADPAATLERLAAALPYGPADPPRARFEYTEIRGWGSSQADPSTPLGTGPGRHIGFWNTGLGTSHTVVIDEVRGCRPESDSSDDDLGPFDGPLSTDPDAVRRQILREPPAADTDTDVFGQIAEFYGARFVPLATRQGVLRMLARQPGIRVQPDVADLLGRRGLAVTLTFRPSMPFTVDQTLIFDARSGQLLAGHGRAHRRPDATTPPHPTDEYSYVWLLLANTYTPNTATPRLTCP
jgi:hypothetical protein